jgi:sulfur-oxidizing protein SoxX
MRIQRAIAVAILLALLPVAVAPAAAQTPGARAPDPAVCSDTANPPKDALTQGGCIGIESAKGNCDACHFITGATSGNIAPPLVGVAQRFDRSRLRRQIEDPVQFNPRSVMPPYGKNEILTPEEMDKLIAWLLTL